MKLTKRQLMFLIESYINENDKTEPPQGEAPEGNVNQERPAKGVTQRVPKRFFKQNKDRFIKGTIRPEEITPPDPEKVKDFAARFTHPNKSRDKANPMSHLSFGKEPDQYGILRQDPYTLDYDPIESDRISWDEAQSYNITSDDLDPKNPKPEKTAQDREVTMFNLPNEVQSWIPRTIEAEDRSYLVQRFLDKFMEERGYTDEDTIPMDEFAAFVRAQGYNFPMKTLQREVRYILKNLL